MQNCLQKRVVLDAVLCDDQPPSPPAQPTGRRLEEARLRVVTWTREMTHVAGRRRAQEIAQSLSRFEVCEIREGNYYAMRYEVTVAYVMGQTAVEVMAYVQDQARRLGQELTSQSIEVCDTHAVVEYTWVPVPSPPRNIRPPPPPFDNMTMVALPFAIGSPLLCICFCCFLFAFTDATKARRCNERKRREDFVPSGPFSPLRPRQGTRELPVVELRLKQIF